MRKWAGSVEKKAEQPVGISVIIGKGNRMCASFKGGVWGIEVYL